MKKALVAYLALFLIVVMAIFMYISCSSFKSQLVDNKVSLTEVSGGRLVDVIEGGLFYGKSLNNYYGIDETVKRWADKDSSVLNVRVISADKKTVYYQMSDKADPNNYDASHINDEVMLEIHESLEEPGAESKGDLCGYLNIVINLDDIVKEVGGIEKMFAVIIGILLLISIAAVALCGRGGVLTDKTGRPDKKKILAVMLSSVIVMQIIFTWYSYNTLNEYYNEMAMDTGEKTEAMIQSDLDKVISMGIDYDRLYGFDQYIDNIRDRLPMISQISVDKDIQVNVDISKEYIRGSLNKLILNMLTALATSIFISAEIVNYMIVSINRRAERLTGRNYYDKPAAVRAASFLIHVACYLPISFIPAMMNQFTGGKAGDFMLGLPTMVLLLFSLVFTIFAGGWCQKYGWKKVLICGVVFLIVSSIISGVIQSAVILVIARGIYGAAYALIYVAIREFAAISSDKEQRSRGLTQVTAGLYAGINIGAVAGAMIYDSIGFMGVFIISALLGGFSMVIIRRHLRDEAHEEEQPCSESKTEAKQLNVMMSVLKSRDFLRLGILIIVPLAIASLFFDYFLPIYAVKANVDSADIGRAFLLNGIAVAYVVPGVLKRIGKRATERAKVVIFTIAMAAGFLIFAIVGGAMGIYIASFIMGIAEGVALVSQNMIMLELPSSKRVGSGQMLAVYAMVRKLAQTAGPQIFTLFMLLGYRAGMAGVGMLIIITSLIYFIITRKGNEYDAKHSA